MTRPGTQKQEQYPEISTPTFVYTKESKSYINLIPPPPSILFSSTNYVQTCLWHGVEQFTGLKFDMQSTIFHATP